MLFDLETMTEEKIDAMPTRKVAKLLDELEHLLNEEQSDDVYEYYLHFKNYCEEVLDG